MRLKRKALLIITALSLAWPGSGLMAMTTAKSWINKVRPGTFALGDSSSDVQTAEEKKKEYSEAELKVLTQLRQREQDLIAKEAQFAQRTAELKRLSQQVEQKLDQMRSLAAKIEEERRRREEQESKDITRMVKYYESMQSENTAAFLNRMDRNTATHILMRMSPRKASAVMQLLDPKVAVEITERVTKFKTNQQEARPK